MSSTVQASVLHGVKDLRLESRPLEALAPSDVQVAVQSTGLCGSDLHYFNHYRNGDIIVREPLTLGHESSGKVVAVGSDVSGLSVGDNVALEVGQPCEECDFCKSGRYNICRGMKFRSSAKAWPHAQGTLQERVNHPARWCHKLPSSISLDLGAVLEPLCVAMHAHARASIAPGATILVLGAGAVGLLVAAVAKARGAGDIIIADIQKDRLDFATSKGYADKSFLVPMERPQTTDDKLELARRVAHMSKESAHGEEMDCVFECTGVETCVQTSIYASKPGAKVLLIGMGTPILTLPMSAAALREVDLVGVFRYANMYPEAIKLLSHPPAGFPDLSTLVTHRFKGMEKIEEAFGMAGRVKDDEGKLVLKVVVDMSS